MRHVLPFQFANLQRVTLLTENHVLIGHKLRIVDHSTCVVYARWVQLSENRVLKVYLQCFIFAVTSVVHRSGL